MRVLHVIPSLSPSSGGPSLALPAMVSSLSGHAVQISIATTDDAGPRKRLNQATAAAETKVHHADVHYFPKQTEFYKVSLPFRHWIHKHVSAFDLVHIHSVFSFTSLIAGRAASAHKVPFIVRPLGVLNRWGMENRRRFIKALSFKWLDLPMLKKAAAMHYTSHMERDEAARFHLENIQSLIPIGLDLSPFDQLPSREVFSAVYPETATTRNLLFLSRIDVKKGLNLLILAFAQLVTRQPNLRLVICGDGDPSYVSQLKTLALQAGIADHITWTGHLSGEMRLAAFASSEIFSLPSHSENFGIALLEAMAAGVPCVSSKGVALASEAAEKEAVLVADHNPTAIANAINSLLNSDSDRRRLSTNARSLARQAYSLEAMGLALSQLYHDVSPSAA